MTSKVLGEVIERYTVPRDRAVIDTPGWDGFAGGGPAKRFWLHDRVMVGGSILDWRDGEHLRHDYKITDVVSFESERVDHGKGWPHARVCWCPFVDVGHEIHPALLAQALDFSAEALRDPEAVLYAHCQMAGGRGPSLGYLICTGVFGEDKHAVIGRIIAAGGNPHPRYLESIDDAVMLWRHDQRHCGVLAHEIEDDHELDVLAQRAADRTRHLGIVVEHYEVPPGPAEPPQEWASGGLARRFWLHPRVMVGGSILDASDGQHLQRDYRITHTLSAESEHLDTGKGFGDDQVCRTPFIDDGAGIPEATVHEALDWAERVLANPGTTLYAHCQLGGSRGPAWGYLVCVGVLGEDPARVVRRLRRAHYRGGDPHGNYIGSIDAGIATWKARRA